MENYGRIGQRVGSCVVDSVGAVSARSSVELRVRFIQDTDRAEVEAIRAQLRRGGAPAHEVLGLPPEPSKAAVVAAFQRLVVKFHPRRYAPGSQVLVDATRALREVRAAYDALLGGAAETVLMPRIAQGSAPDLKPLGMEPVHAGAAEESVQLRAALGHIRERAWASAAAVLELAVAAHPASTRCMAYLYFVRGQLADEAGQSAIAVAAWQNALACDGTLSAARNALAMYAQRSRR